VIRGKIPSGRTLMLDTQSVIIANGVTIVMLGFFVRLWINGVNEKIKETLAKLDQKVDDRLCTERRERIESGHDDHCEKNAVSFRECFGRLRDLEQPGRRVGG
jgi:hypothetical protein